MGSRAPSVHIDISHIHSVPRSGSRGPSASVSEEDEDGVQVSAQEISPHYSVVQAPSHSGSSSLPGEFEPLRYPDEAVDSEGEQDFHPPDPASRLVHRQIHPVGASRSSSIHRVSSQPRTQPQGLPPRSRPRGPATSSTTDDADSAEEYIHQPEYAPRMTRPQSHYGPAGYPHSNSSGSYAYPPVPPQHQMIHYQPPPQQPGPYQYPHPASPPPGYLPSHHGYPPAMVPGPGSHVSSPYSQGPYGPPSVMQYAQPSGYFTPQYPPQHYSQFAPQFMQQWQQLPPHVSPQSYYTGSEPPRQAATSPPPSEPKVDEESIMKKMQALLLAERDERERKEVDRQKSIQSAEDKQAAYLRAEEERQNEQAKIRRDARLAAEEEAAAARRAEKERREEERRIREEARREALEAEKLRIAAEAERAAYEQKIRKEAADAALAAAAADAQAKKEQADREAKIAAEAAEAAKSAAQKEAAEAAAAAEAEAKKASDEAATKLKEAEAAAEAAKKEAADAEAKAKAAAPPEKKDPIKFRDALGRNYNFPWDRCCKWHDMEGLINQAFAHIKDIGPHVLDGHYDLIGPDKEIIMPEYWEESIAPNMQITMMLWPLPEPAPEPEPVPPPLDGDIINIDDLLSGKKSKKPGKSGSKKTKPGGFSTWMLGGAPSRSKPTLKGDKKPDAVAALQHGAVNQDACTIM